MQNNRRTTLKQLLRGKLKPQEAQQLLESSTPPPIVIEWTDNSYTVIGHHGTRISDESNRMTKEQMLELTKGRETVGVRFS